MLHLLIIDLMPIILMAISHSVGDYVLLDSDFGVAWKGVRHSSSRNLHLFLVLR